MKSPWLCAVLAVSSATWAWSQQAGPQAGGNVNASNSQVLHLDDLVRQALDKSVEAQSALHTIEAMKHHLPQAQALPDPTVAVGWAGNPAPFSIMARDASSYRGATVSEQFPYPGKLKLQGAIAGKDVEAAQAAYEAIRRRIILEAKTAYYEYFYDRKALQTAQHNKELLETLTQLAESQYRVGKASQSDVLRSQVEVSLLLEKLIVLEEQRDEAQARINTLLVRSVETPLAPAEELQPATIPDSIEQLYTSSAENDAAKAIQEKQIERDRLSVKLAERQLRPDFGVSYMLQQRADQATMNGLTFSVSIPVFNKTKQRPAIAEAAENLISAEKSRDSRLNQIRYEVKQQYLVATAANKLMTLYSKGVIPQTSLAYESSLAAYQTGKGDMQSALANISTLLNYETDYYRQLADYQTALARIESLTNATPSASPSTPAIAAATKEK
jgi:outer membrane protein TolC